jgi:hypothetical protein
MANVVSLQVQAVVEGASLLVIVVLVWCFCDAHGDGGNLEVSGATVCQVAARMTG